MMDAGLPAGERPTFTPPPYHWKQRDSLQLTRHDLNLYAEMSNFIYNARSGTIALSRVIAAPQT